MRREAPRRFAPLSPQASEIPESPECGRLGRSSLPGGSNHTCSHSEELGADFYSQEDVLLSDFHLKLIADTVFMFELLSNEISSRVVSRSKKSAED